MALPAEISIYAIEVADVTTFSEICTEAVNRAIPLVVEMIIKELD